MRREQLTAGQHAARRAARDAGAAGLTSGTHHAALTEGPTLLDRGYLAESGTGTLVLTAAGAAIVPADEPSTGAIEDAG